MNKIIICFVLLISNLALAQPMSEPMKSKYRQAKTIRDKGRVLLDYEKASSADSTIIVQRMALLEWYKKNNDPIGANYTELYLATAFLFKSDDNGALRMCFPILKRFEQQNDDYGRMRVYHTIGNAYSVSKNYKLAFVYLKKSIAIAEKIDPVEFLSIACNDISVNYSLTGNIILAQEYAQKALQLSMESEDTARIPVRLSTVAETYIAAGDYDIAISILRKMRKYRMPSGYIIPYVDNDYAQAYLGLRRYDSVIFYAHRSLSHSIRSSYKDQALRSYEYLIAAYKQIKEPDSLGKYYELAMHTKDDLYDMEKLRSIENIHFAEQLRQKELEVKRIKAEEDRRHMIQYAIIATAIITFFIAFLLLSRTIIVNEKWISFLSILALLLVFEFINLLIHPFLGNLTHHSPILMLLCMVILASMLIPLHHKLEHFIKHKLTEKNKAIRLAAAKKTIEQLKED